MIDRPAPSDADTEASILSALLSDGTPATIATIREVVRPDDFFDSALRQTFAVICALSEEGRAVDAVNVAATLNTRGYEGHEIVVDILDDTLPPSDLVAAARIIRQHSEARSLLRTLEQESAALRAGMAPAKVAARLADATLEIAAPGSGRGFVTAAVVARELAVQLADRAEITRNGGIAGVGSGWWEVDDITGGFLPGELIFVAGVPASGKTAVAFQMALTHACRHDRPHVGFVSAEMGRHALMERGVNNLARVATTHTRRMLVSDNEGLRITSAIEQLTTLNLHIDDTPTPHIGDVTARARALKARHPSLSLLVVDFMQLLRGDEDQRSEELRTMSYQLKGLAKLLGIPVIVPVQVNDRELAKRADKRPQLEDIQGSSGMRQAADFIATVYRPAQYDGLAGNEIELLWLKARGLPVFTSTLTAELEYMRVASKPTDERALVARANPNDR